MEDALNKIEEEHSQLMKEGQSEHGGMGNASAYTNNAPVSNSNLGQIEIKN